MERRDFLFNSCRACLGLMAIPAIASLESCATTKAAASAMTEENGMITLPAAELAGKNTVLLHPKSVSDPLLVVKQADGSYKALLMHCPHKGGPVQEVGDQLKCDWHGSTFDHQGNVTGGPAKSGLTSYPVEVAGDKLHIHIS